MDILFNIFSGRLLCKVGVVSGRCPSAYLGICSSKSCYAQGVGF